MIDLKHLLFSFNGRIGRQYWWLTSLAVAFISGMANAVIEVAAKTSGHGAIDPQTQEFIPSWPYIVGILALGLLNVWISYAVAAKRLHDRNRTGWVTVALIALWILVELGCLKGSAGPNRYGPDPLGQPKADSML